MLHNEFQTPCFILDEKELGRSILGFQNALNNNFPKATLGYSVKTNSLPYSLREALKYGCFAEVVSYDEYNLARTCGYDVRHIIYNGPMKSKESFLEAVQGGAIVNIETKREIKWLRELPLKNEYSVGIRLNINISKVSPDDADGDNDNSRFGFSDETNEFIDVIKQLKEMPNIRLAGLHIHRTAHSRSLRFYDKSIRYACEVIKKYGLELAYLDVGGGYYGIFPNKPTYQQYSNVFYLALMEYGLEHLRVIVEPGNALVASCFHFLCEVIDVKHVEENRWFITTDGSRNDVDPFFRKSSYMTEIVSKGNGQIVKEQVIGGCTCLEYDRLFTIDNSKLLGIGDRILYKNVGAYTMCLSPLFIRYYPKIYVMKDDEISLIRDSWGANEYIQKSIIQ